MPGPRLPSRGDLPAGLFFNETAGEIVGLPTQAGVFTVTLKVTNSGGTATRSLTISILPVLTIAVHGPGTISPALPAQSDRSPGEAITLVAKVSPGGYFAGWAGDFPTPNAVLTFTMDGNHVVRAEFGKYTSAKGTYAGLVQADTPAHATTGFLSLAVTATGGFTGTAAVAGRAYKLRGSFPKDGRFSGTATRAGATALPVVLQLGLGKIDGLITIAGVTVTVRGERPVYSKANPAPQAGRYTVLLPPASATGAPAGHGYALTISDTGVAKFTGKLANGVSLSQSSTMTADGHWPFYLSLAGGSGSLAGEPEIGETGITGVLDWFSSGFDAAGATLTVQGSPFIPPSAEQPLLLELPNGGRITLQGGGILNNPHLVDILLLPNKKVSSSTPGFSLSITSSTGLFSGKFINSARSKPVSFSGALFQAENRAAGYFTGVPAQAGNVALEAKP